MNQKRRNDRNRENNPPRRNGEDRWFDDGGRNFPDQGSSYSSSFGHPQPSQYGYGQPSFQHEANQGYSSSRGEYEQQGQPFGQGQSCPQCGHSQFSGSGYSQANTGAQFGYYPQPAGESYRGQPTYEQHGSVQGRGGYGTPGNFGGQQTGRGSYQQRGDYGSSSEGGGSGSQQQQWGSGGSSSMGDWRSNEGTQRKYFGRGPKGYKRSDERIQEDVSDVLADGYLDASEISVSVQNGEVTLSGTVDSRQTKFLAENMVEGVSGVTDVNNQLRVSREMTGSSTREGETGRSSGSRNESATNGGNQQRTSSGKPVSMSTNR